MNFMNKYGIIRKKVVLIQVLFAFPGVIISHIMLSYFFAIPYSWINIPLGISAMIIGLAHSDYKKMKTYLSKKNRIKMPGN